MYKVIYLNEIEWFDTFEELKHYYGCDTAADLEELNEMLKERAAGMVTPEIIEKNF